MVFFIIFVYLLETTGHNMEKKNEKPQEVIIKQGSKSTKDYLAIKEWEAARERSIEKAIYKYYKIKE